MKFAIISDTHLGFQSTTERRDDAYTQFEDALDQAIKEKVDFILLGGDIFDQRIPTQDVFIQAIKLLLKPRGAKPTRITAEMDGKPIVSTALQGIPVFGIYGTHERRGRDLVNPMHVMEQAGLLTLMHCNHAVVEKNGERVALHGLCGVPERYARQVLEQWNPQPVTGAHNVFIMHQNVGEYIYSPNDIKSLRIDDLPQGFDLLLDGHIHWHDIQKQESGAQFAIIGSTVCTQMRKVESENPKGFLTYDTETKKIEFHELKTARVLHYLTISLKDTSLQDALAKIDAELVKIPNTKRKPLVRIRLEGELQKGFSSSDLNTSLIEQKYKERFIMRVDKARLTMPGLEEHRALIEQLREKQLSVDELGLEILGRHLHELEYKTAGPLEELFQQFASGDTDAAYEYVKKQMVEA